MFKILLRAFNYRERRDKSDSARCYLDLLYQEGLVTRKGQPFNGWDKAVLRKEDPLKGITAIEKPLPLKGSPPFGVPLRPRNRISQDFKDQPPARRLAHFPKRPFQPAPLIMRISV